MQFSPDYFFSTLNYRFHFNGYSSAIYHNRIRLVQLWMDKGCGGVCVCLFYSHSKPNYPIFGLITKLVSLNYFHINFPIPYQIYPLFNETLYLKPFVYLKQNTVTGTRHVYPFIIILLYDIICLCQILPDLICKGYRASTRYWVKCCP